MKDNYTVPIQATFFFFFFFFEKALQQLAKTGPTLHSFLEENIRWQILSVVIVAQVAKLSYELDGQDMISSKITGI
jgi:hypothetical protein